MYGSPLPPAPPPQKIKIRRTDPYVYLLINFTNSLGRSHNTYMYTATLAHVPPHIQAISASPQQTHNIQIEARLYREDAPPASPR